MIKIILFLSGNFPQLAKIEKELKMAELTEKIGSGYHRLLTFYYKKHCETVLNVSKQLKGNKKWK